MSASGHGHGVEGSAAEDGYPCPSSTNTQLRAEPEPRLRARARRLAAARSPAARGEPRASQQPAFGGGVSGRCVLVIMGQGLAPGRPRAPLRSRRAGATCCEAANWILLGSTMRTPAGRSGRGAGGRVVGAVEASAGEEQRSELSLGRDREPRRGGAAVSDVIRRVRRNPATVGAR